jgi:DNA-binding transcriptional LysR family regulator
MTLQQLKYAIAIADNRSINKAAKLLFMSQPALSDSVKDLETELGITIFERTNKGALLTSEGSDFMSYARQMIEQSNLIEDRYVKKRKKQKFAVSTQHYTFAVKAFVELIGKYGMDHYEFGISETKTYEVIEDVKQFRSEIGILYLDSFNTSVLTKLFRENNLTYTKLFSCKVYVYLAASHPLADRSKIRFEELAEYPCLSFQQGQNNSFYFAEEALSTLDYQKIVKCNDRATILNLMIGLNGYTICSGIICEDLNGASYKAIPLEDNEIMTIIYITREGTTLSKLGEQYIELLKSKGHGTAKEDEEDFLTA